MPRSKRITLSGYPHLVIARAAFPSLLFNDPEDYHHYLERLRQLVRDKVVELYAFCLLPTEIRLTIKPIKYALAQVMQRLNCSHTVAINRKRAGKGHVFYGRYQSLVFPDADILSVVRSVHLWPVRARLVRRAENYPWSSHPIYLGTSNAYSNMINATKVLSEYFDSDRSMHRSYDRFVEAAALEEDSFGVAEVCEGIGGNGHQVNELLTKANYVPPRRRRPSLPYLAGKVQLVLNITGKQLTLASRRQDFVMARRLLATVATCDAEKSIAEVARFLCRDKAQISRLVSQGIDLVEYDDTFRLLYEAIGGVNLRNAEKGN